ncbi:hypothetical protein ACTA71_004819 [Dictyostelium dimigraforme]
MKSILILLLLLVLSTEKCLSAIYSVGFYSGYEYQLSVKTEVFINSSSASIRGYDVIYSTFNSSHYTISVSSHVTNSMKSFVLDVIINGSLFDRYSFSLKAPNIESVKYFNNFAQVEIIGKGLRYSKYYNFDNEINCDQDISFNNNNNERFVCGGSLSNTCMQLGIKTGLDWYNNSYSLIPSPTINSIEKLGSSLLIDANFNCPYLETKKGISINKRQSFNSLVRANINIETLFSYDPSGFSVCLDDDTYSIFLISQVNNLTLYSDSVQFSCKEGIVNKAAISTLSSVSLLSFLFILLIL